MSTSHEKNKDTSVVLPDSSRAVNEPDLSSSLASIMENTINPPAPASLTELENNARLYSKQKLSNCICFANGGMRYRFKLESEGIKQFTGETGTVEEFDYYAVKIQENDGEWKEFSPLETGETLPDGTDAPLKGSFVHFEGDFDKQRDYDKKANRIRERKKTFEEAGITLEKITTDNNRVFAQGKDRQGNFRFFWAQLEDSFPLEPEGARLPGVFVRTPTCDEEKLTRFQIISKIYTSNVGRHHPCWFLQWFGGKVESLLSFLYMENSIFNAGNVDKGISAFTGFLGWVKKMLVLGVLTLVLGFGPLLNILKKVAGLTKKYKNIPQLTEAILKDIEELGTRLAVSERRLNGFFGSIHRGIINFLRRFELFRPLVEMYEDESLLPGTLESLVGNIKNLLRNVNTTMPVIAEKHIWYEIGLSTLGQTKENKGREVVKIKNVIDIGICNPHRFEHYTKDNGAEIHAWIYGQVIENFKYSKLTYFDFIPPLFFLIGKLVDFAKTLLPNMRVHDGMGFNDGLCNFFMLAEIEPNPAYGIQSNYAVIWADEQEAFSERWHYLTPLDKEYNGKIGMLSVFSAIEWYHGNVQQLLKFIYPEELLTGGLFKTDKIHKYLDLYTASLPYDKLSGASRLAVSRYPLLLTGNDNRLYSCSVNWGVTDYRWNSRALPGGKQVFPDTLKVRDDLTIAIYGSNEHNRPGWFFQKYLPQGILQSDFSVDNYSDAPFTHPWYFVTEDTYEVMDRYYNFGIYDAYDEINNLPGGYYPLRKDRTFYAYPGIDQRSQYYKVVCEDDETRNRVRYIIEQGPVEWEPAHQVLNPFFKEYKVSSKKSLYLNVTLRWDKVDKTFVALYTHPRNDDIYDDLERDGSLTEWFPCNEDLTGTWKAKGLSEKSVRFDFVERVRDFSPPAVKKAVLHYIKATDSVRVTLTNHDPTIRFVTIGAVIPISTGEKAGRRISQRYDLTFDDLYEPLTDFSQGRPLKSTVVLDIPLDNQIKLDLGLVDWSAYFSPLSQLDRGTSIWFEDILGHKNTAEEFVIQP